MENQQVIVRNFDGRPLRRVVFDATERTILVMSNETRMLVESGLMPAIGVPEGGIFEMDEAVMDSLEKEWNQNGGTQPATWNRLNRYRPLRR